MTALLPVAVYGLKVPAGEVMIPATVDFPATFRITMAAIDPTETLGHTGVTSEVAPPRATLKLVYDPSGPGSPTSSQAEDDEEDTLRRLLRADDDGDDEEEDEDDIDDEESSSDDEEKNGGPSDPSKSKKARKRAAVAQLLESLAEPGENDMDLDEKPKVNGVEARKLDKGKGKAIDTLAKDDEDLDEEEGSDSTDGLEEIVVCTLDAEKNYQQPLDLTIPEDQEAFFKVSGNFTVYLTGNYVIPDDKEPKQTIYDDDEDDDYDSASDENELGLDESESDELDSLEDPRITEVASEDEDEAPALVKKAEPKKGKNKRAAEDSDGEPSTNLDDIMAKALKPTEPSAEAEPKLTKKQMKKLKKNDGKAAAPATEASVIKPEAVKEKTDKKVSFAKDLEEGASSSATVNGEKKPSPSNPDTKASGPKRDVKIVQGVTIDDRKTGTGRAAKKGDRVGMRYIGKLKDGKVFDANKKGPPFKFKLGDGSVIKGWDIGVAGMAVGGERRIIVPPNLAYGSKKLPDIPANSELTFDLKLLEIN